MSFSRQEELSGKVALVTGAARGIGAAIAESLASQGACVAMFDRQTSITTCATRLADKTGAHTLGLVVDVSDADATASAVHAVEKELGPIDILVNVAGILRLGSALELSAQDWQDSLAINSGGVFNISTAVARRMVEYQQQRRGNRSIITVGSNAAATPRIGMAAYAASKAAAHQFTMCLGLELAQHGIRCNIVSPGSTDTPMQQQLGTSSAARDSVLKGSPESFRLGIPLQRIATPDDIADAVCFLASDRARHITLHDLRVDGGATLDAG